VLVLWSFLEINSILLLFQIINRHEISIISPELITQLSIVLRNFCHAADDKHHGATENKQLLAVLIHHGATEKQLLADHLHRGITGNKQLLAVLIHHGATEKQLLADHIHHGTTGNKQLLAVHIHHGATKQLPGPNVGPTSPAAHSESLAFDT
jgi:hypothetical protein